MVDNVCPHYQTDGYRHCCVSDAVGVVQLMISVGRASYTGPALLHLHLSSGLDRSEM